MTIINFHCNESADNKGKGGPEFDTEVDCTYIFNWGTKYACVEQKNLVCRTSDGKKHYDLSRLTRYSAVEVAESDSTHNWEAVYGSKGTPNRRQLYINVCHQILQDGGAVGCPDDAAICAITAYIICESFHSACPSLMSSIHQNR
uniref:Cation-independent mannose-6-phosphate receptor-like n=1 Tax=Callorhinchus milii TaxID=7868 RepID=A0A4W3HXA8_CALMI